MTPFLGWPCWPAETFLSKCSHYPGIFNFLGSPQTFQCYSHSFTRCPLKGCLLGVLASSEIWIETRWWHRHVNGVLLWGGGGGKVRSSRATRVALQVWDILQPLSQKALNGTKHKLISIMRVAANFCCQLWGEGLVPWQALSCSARMAESRKTFP